MVDLKVDIAKTTTAFSKIFKNKETAPFYLFAILFIFTMLVIIGILMLVLTYLSESAETQRSKNEEYYKEIIKSYGESIKLTTPAVNNLTAGLNSLNSVISDLNKIREQQKDTDFILKDHERRITKIEIRTEK